MEKSTIVIIVLVLILVVFIGKELDFTGNVIKKAVCRTETKTFEESGCDNRFGTNVGDWCREQNNCQPYCNSYCSNIGWEYAGGTHTSSMTN